MPLKVAFKGVNNNNNEYEWMDFEYDLNSLCYDPKNNGKVSLKSTNGGKDMELHADQKKILIQLY